MLQQISLWVLLPNMNNVRLKTKKKHKITCNRAALDIDTNWVPAVENRGEVSYKGRAFRNINAATGHQVLVLYLKKCLKLYFDPNDIVFVRLHYKYG